ncbi:MAG: hypothetical protein KC635_11390, partial [Myxococcales bacterium]|nr:hypothetical protein [Myxococcales bacterium]
GAGGPAAPAPDLAGADPDAPTARVELPPVPPEPAPAAAPRLPNEVVEQDLVAGVAANRYAAAQERVYVRVDKPLYRPGETIWFESLDVAARTLDATGPGTFDAALVDPRGVEVARKRIGGVAGRAHNDFELAAGAPGGEYTLRVASLDGARGERKLVVASYQPPRVKKKLEFVRKAYGAGDEVTATLELHAPTGEPIAAKTVVAAPRLDGRDLDRVEATTNADGGALVRFRLPDDVAVGDGLLTVLVDAGGVTESVSKRIPIIVKKLQLSFFPEGGDLVAGLASRVYFAAENTLGKPADMAGRVVDDHDQTVATFRSEKNGMGRFSLLPATGRRYYAVVDSPVGVTERYALPVAKEDGCVLRAYDDFDGQAPALRAGVRCATPRKVVVSAVQREQVLDVATVDAGPEREAVVALAAKNDALARAQGVARVTVFGEGLTPLAERIVYRNRRSRLGVSLSADQERYGPRDEVALEVETRDAAGAPVAATVTLSVVDDTVIAYADDKSGDLASRLLLEPELSGEVEEPNTYLDLTEAGSGSALDLLMGTKGWRRFSWVALDVASTTSAPATHAARLNRQQRGKGVVVLEEIAIEGAVAGPGAVEMPEEEDLGGVAMADAAEAQRPEPDDLLQAAVLGDAKALEEKPRDANAAMPEPPPAADPAPMARPEVVAMEKALPAEKPPFAVNKEEGKLGGGGFGQLRANADDDLERLDDGVLGLADRRRAPIAMAPVREFPLPSYSPGYAGPRTDFRDTVLWAPAVTTGADGKATVRFPLSDAVTSFRAVAEGLAGGEVGRAELVVASSLPFSMSAKVPAAVTARDAMRLPLTLTNETDAPQEVVVTADLGALLTLDDPADAERRVVLAPHSAQTLFYAARPGRGTGTSTAHFRAEAGGLGDELHQDVVVDPAGFPQTLSASGELGESGARHDLNLGDALPGTIVASVSLYPSPVASMVKGLDGMLREPSGCFEQASSTNYPNVMVMRYLESHEEAAPAVLARSKALLERGYAMLTGYETAQKGYEWFGQAP